MFLLYKIIRLAYIAWSVILFVCITLFFLLVWLPIHVVLRREKKQSWTWWISRMIVRVFFFFVGIRIKNIFIYTKDKNRRPSNSKALIYIANHCSYMDVLTLYGSKISSFFFLAKKAYTNVPLFGYFYSKASINVTREQRKSRSTIISELQHILTQKKQNIFIFPEGTFNETSDMFIAFHIGAFTLAIKTRTVICPLLLIDTKKRMHPASIFSIRPGINRIVHLPIVDIHLHQNMSAVELMKHTESKMRSAWGRFL